MSNDLAFGESIKTDIFGEALEVETKVEKEVKVVEEDPLEVEKVAKEKVKKEEKEVEAETNVDVEIEKEEESDYNKLAEDLVNNGLWEAFELEDDVVLDKETFEELRKEQRLAKDGEAEKRVLGKLSKADKEYLDFVNKGGNLEDYVATFQMKKAVEKIDITTEQGKKSSVYAYYKNIIGWTDERVVKHIKRLEEDLELDDEAELTNKKLNEYVDNEHNKVVSSQKDRVEKRKKVEEEYQANIRTELKIAKTSSKESNVIVNAFTKRDDKGYTEIDKKFLEVRNDPKRAKYLWDILMDEENFIKKITQKKVNENELNTFKKFKIGKAKKSKSDTSSDGSYVDYEKI